MLFVALGACSYSLSGGLHAGGGGGSPATSNGGGGGGSYASGGDGGGGGGPTSGPELWKAWTTHGIMLGTSRAELAKAGFKCGERANSRCFKIIDDRCKTGRCELGEDQLMGEQWLELNGARTELDYMSIATTETDAAKAYDIRYVFGPRQLLTPESTLGKAIISKYGKPADVSTPMQGDPAGGGRFIIWNKDLGGNGPQVAASCDPSNANEPAKSKTCSITVSDEQIRTVERRNQEDRDKQKMLKAQPTAAPTL
ncbi:MAG TPA: hypothetical protein VGM88_11205 [Kofleriaceae bacterium]